MCLDKLELVLKIAETLYDKSFDHGLPHVRRVLNWAMRISRREKLKLSKQSLLLAVYLHDTGRFVGEPHAYYSAVIAEYLLKELKCPDSLLDEVLSAISAHSYSYAKASGVEPKSDLGRVLSDADKLDALGIVGFLRVFIYGEREHRDLVFSVQHFYEKIFYLKDLLYYTYSKRVAEKLTLRTSRLLDLLLKELGIREFRARDTNHVAISYGLKYSEEPH